MFLFVAVYLPALCFPVLSWLFRFYTVLCDSLYVVVVALFSNYNKSRAISKLMGGGGGGAILSTGETVTHSTE